MRDRKKRQDGVLEMCYYGDPVLRQVAKPIVEITPEIRDLANAMVITMRDEDGIGLAAPQIGVSLRMFVVELPLPDRDDEEAPPVAFATPGEQMLVPRMPLAFINPRFTEMSEQEGAYVEGCLSIPGLSAAVDRPDFVTLDATLLTGEHVHLRCGGLLARVLQHELDHLDGRLSVDMIHPEDAEILAPKLKKMEQETLKALRKKRR